MTDPAKAEKVRLTKIEGTGIQIIRWQKGDRQWTTIEKQYKDKRDGSWKKSNLYFDEELAKVRDILNKEFPELDGIEVVPQEDDDMPY